MNSASTFQYYYLSYLSRPAHERCLYRALRRTRVRSIVEIGLGHGRRALRLLSVARRFRPEDRLSYAGIDLFDARPADRPPLKLKDAHCRLTRAGVQLRLVPGDLRSALARSANALTNTDLVIISADYDDAALEAAWFYLPRMIHDRSLAYWETITPRGRRFRRLTAQEIAVRASLDAPRRAA